MRSLLLVESLDLRPSNQYILVREIPSCLHFAKNVCAPGKSSVEIKSKVFDIVLLWDLNIIYMHRWARFASCSERHMDPFSFVSFNLSFYPGLDCEESGLEFLGSRGVGSIPDATRFSEK
jgi:hypothetical protein